MTAPTPYNRIFSFTNFQTANPSLPLPGNEVDAELNAVKATTDATIASLSLIQRSDGQLANQSVGPQQLLPSLLAGISPATQWSGLGVSYQPGNTVFSGLLLYVCNTANVSSAGAPPASNMNWTFLADFSGVAIPPGSITSAAFAPGAVNSAALGSGLALPASPSPGDNSTAIATTAFVDAAIAAIGGLAPSGAVSMFAGSAAPAGWFICNGQAVSRSSNPNLFSAIGTTYGAGDGSTTFNVPNYAGKAPVALGGADSVTLNQQFGASTVALSQANLAAHTHTDSGHTHGITQNPHGHGASDSGHTHSVSNVTAGGSSLGTGVGWGFGSTNTGAGFASITVAAANANLSINSATANLSSVGSGTPFSVYQPSVGVNFIIRGG